jgi:alkanesulfonate monooxygenase SsuD/methylene tetrahydromethanopterin reductase-like flavin-dependent oxidoreductase (luciferase family)
MKVRIGISLGPAGTPGLSGASVAPLPERPPDIWLGGSAPAGLRRVGRQN